MNGPTTVDVLNRLIAIHRRSLPVYLTYASPTWHRGDAEARDRLQRIAADQEATADRLGQLVVERDGAVEYGTFPMEFTAYHDLSFGFLLDKLIEHQKRDVEAIERCVAQLDRDEVARALAEEALRAAKTHLDMLQTLRAGRCSASAGA